MIGLVAFSFGQRADELNDPCLSNLDLARRVVLNVLEARLNGEDVLIVAQWEVANALKREEINDPSLSGLDRAKVVRGIVFEKYDEKRSVPAVNLWEDDNALTLVRPPIVSNLVIWGPRPGKELNSDEVMAQAAEFLRPRGVRKVVIVAFPFLHLPFCRRLARKERFVVLPRQIGPIRCDKKSTTYWTRSRSGLLLYALRRTVTGRRGPYPPIPTPPRK